MRTVETFTIVILTVNHYNLACWICFGSLLSSAIQIQWNLGYTSKSGLKNLDVELRGTYK